MSDNTNTNTNTDTDTDTTKNVIISIDTGDGESAAQTIEIEHIINAQNSEEQQDDVRYDVKPLHFDNMSGTVYSRIFITQEQMEALQAHAKNGVDYSLLQKIGPFTVGNFLKQNRSPGTAYNYFKVQPSRFDDVCSDELSKKYGITYGMVMGCFMYSLVEQLLRNNPTLAEYKTNRASLTLLAGCPTSKDWLNKKSLTQYRKLITRATGLKQVVIIPESHAAMFSSIKNSKKDCAINADKGTLVMDFGSSTADCTYMLMGQLRKGFSWALGARCIEIAMFDYLVNEYNQNPKNNHKINRAQILKSIQEAYRKLRCIKEEFVTSNNDISESVIIEGDESFSQKRHLDIKCDEAFMHKIIDGTEIEIPIKDGKGTPRVERGSIYAIYQAFFEYAKAWVQSSSVNGKPCPVDTIVITGGASKMPFIRELCEEVFSEVKKEHIHIEPNPSYCVSNGLCWAFLSEQQIPRCAENAFETVVCDEKVKVESMASDICDSLIPVLSDIIEKKAITWGESAEDLSIEDLVNDIKSTINTTEVQDNIKKCVLEGVNHWDEGCKKVIHSAVLEQAKLLYGDHLPVSAAAIKHKAVCIDGLSLEKAIKDICNNLTKVMQELGLSATFIILGIAIIAICIATGGIIGFLAPVGLFLVLYGKKVAKLIPIPKKIYKKKISKDKREAVKDNIHEQFTDTETLGEIKEKIIKKVQKQLTEQGMTQSEINKQLKKSIEEAIEIWLLKKFAQEEVDCVD